MICLKKIIITTTSILIIFISFIEYSTAELSEFSPSYPTSEQIINYFNKSYSAAMKLAKENIIEDFSSNPNDYKIENSITRGEIAKIILNLSKKEVTNTCLNKFKDLTKDNWACKYAEAGLLYGIFSLNENFRPNDPVTKIEALKMIMQARGINKSNNSDWKIAYVEAGVQKSILSSTYEDYDSIINRGSVFILATNEIVDWKAYKNSFFDISINIPSSWKEVMPGDGSLEELNDDTFKGFTTITSSGSDEKLTFINKPLEIKDYDCNKSTANIKNIVYVVYTKCKNVSEDQIPGKYNYEFVDKNLIIVANKETETTLKIISSIK